MKKTLGLCALLALTACISIQGSFKSLYGYQQRTAEESPGLIQKAPEIICSLQPAQKPQVFPINGKQLKNCLVTSERAMVYVWDPLCSGATCYPVGRVQQFCNQRGFELYIVSQFYDSASMNQLYAIKRPIFGIDCDYYRSNLTSKYLKAFLQDLDTQYTLDKLLRFEKGRFIQSCDRLEDF